MKKLATLLALLLPLAAAPATFTTALQTEVLVLTTTTVMPRLKTSQGFEIQNLGPNPIWCAFGVAAVANKARLIAANGGSWSAGVTGYVLVNCIAGTANQVTGAATIISEQS